MSNSDRTTVSLSKATRNRLFERKRPAESYDDTVTRLLERTEPEN